MREQIIERILEKKIIAIVRGLDTRYLLPLVQALLLVPRFPLVQGFPSTLGFQPEPGSLPE